MGAQRRCDRRELAGTAGGPEGVDQEFTAALVGAIKLLRGRATMLAGEGSLADDFAQATLERALRAAHRPPICGVQQWLTRILKNVAIDHWRAVAVRRSCELDPEITPAPLDTEEHYWWRDLDSADVERAARTLPVTFRQLFLLRLQGCSNNEIARRLGLNAATVATRFFRGRGLMQLALATSCLAGGPIDPPPSCRDRPFVRSSAGESAEWERASSI